MMFKNSLFTIIIVLFIFSCKNNYDVDQNLTRSIRLENQEKAKASKFFSEIDYYLIKSDERFPLVNPYKTLLYGSRIFLLDKFQNFIFIYNQGGDLEKIIKDIGEGPDQFLQIDDFQVNNNEIIIKDGRTRNMLTYDFSGALISVEKNNFLLGDFYKGEGVELYYVNNDPQFEGRIIKSKNGKISSMIPMEPWMENKLFGSINGFMINPNTNTINYILPFGYQYLEFSNEGELIKQVEFDFGKYSFKSEQRARFNNFEDESKYLEGTEFIRNIFSIHPFGNGFLMYLMQENRNRHYVWLDENLHQKNQYAGIENDIDGMLLSLPPWTYSEDAIYFLYYPGQFINDYNSSFPNPQGDELKLNEGVHFFVNENKDLLESENFVLVKLKIK